MTHLKRIKRFYLIAVTVTLILSELIFNFVTLNYFEDQMLRQIYKQNQRQLEQLFDIVHSFSKKTKNTELLGDFLQQIAKTSYNGSESFVCFLDSTGKIIAHGDPGMIGADMHGASVSTAKGDYPFWKPTVLVDGEMPNHAYKTTEIVSTKYDHALKLNISTHEDKSKLNERIWEIRKQVLLLGLSLFVVFIFLGYWLTFKFVNRYITQIEVYEKRIIKDNEKLAYVNEQLNDYSTIVSHDVASPLSIISMTLQLVRTKFSGEAFLESVQPYFEKIDNAVADIKRLTQDLLTASKKSDQDDHISPVDLLHLFQKIKQMYDTVDGKITVILKNDFPTLTLDRSKFEVIVSNIISNGLKYNNSETKRITIGYLNQDRHVISIHDNGMGIKASELPKIFDKYYRSSNKIGKEGHGIGLHMVRKLAKLMGAELTVDSTEHSGTTFFLRLQKSENER